MRETQIVQPRAGKLGDIAAILSLLAVLILMVHWGGSVVTGPVFALGVALLIGAVVVFGVAAWWPLFSPLPAREKVKERPAYAMRQLLSALVAVGGLLFIIGGFWDEYWHRLYGVGEIVNDFWWRPHILIYASLGLNALFAFGGMFTIMRGVGSMRARFRREPLLGVLILTSGFQLVFAPIDPIWHEIYGLDLTAWSLPHLLLMVSYAVLMFGAIAMQLSLVPRRVWGFLRAPQPADILITLLITLTTFVTLQVGTAEWEGLTFRSVMGEPAMAARPEWLFPVVLTAVSAFLGTIALRVTRDFSGMATLLGVLILAIRLLLLAIFDAYRPEAGLSFQSHVLLLPPLIALDVFYMLRRHAADHPLTVIGGGIAAAVGILALSVPIMSRIMEYPRVIAETLPGMIVFSLLIGIGSAVLGARITGLLTRYQPEAALEQTNTSAKSARDALLIAAGTFAAALIFVLIFIVTATPPSV